MQSVHLPWITARTLFCNQPSANDNDCKCLISVGVSQPSNTNPWRYVGYLLNYSAHVFELYMISIQPISRTLDFLQNYSRAMRICVDGCRCPFCANRPTAHLHILHNSTSHIFHFIPPEMVHIVNVHLFKSLIFRCRLFIYSPSVRVLLPQHGVCAFWRRSPL